MTDEIDDDELERRMRAKLFGNARSPGSGNGKPRLSDEDQRIAERLLGHDNARRLSTAKEGRRVYVAPVRVSYEWYWFQYGSRWDGEIWRWRINRLENGRARTTHGEGYLSDELDEEIAKLKAKGMHVVDQNFKQAPARSKQPKVSARKAALDELRFFRR